jgi:purine nucleosidase
MTPTRREFIKTVGAAIATTQIADAASRRAGVPASPLRRKVIYDQDLSGPFGTDVLATLMMLQADNIDLRGITLVTGDAWLKQEMAYTLRLLEMMHRTDIPVYLGAEMPMLNTKEEWQLRQQLYGGHRLDPWMGAFNRTNAGPDAIEPLAAPYERFAKIKPEQEHAARFIVKTVRANPHEVTIYAGGPLTNIALAIALAPDIVALIPEIVVMGTGFHTFTNTFNMFFDPEAARKVLRAPWPNLTILPVDLAEEIHEDDEIAPMRRMVDEIANRAQAPSADLFRIHAVAALQRKAGTRLFRMADEMLAARLIDPGIFTKAEEMYVDICTSPGPRYGDAMFWRKYWQETPAEARGAVSASDRRVFVDPSQFYLGPPPSAGLVNVLLEADHERFKRLFVDLMTAPLKKPEPYAAV